MSEYFDFDKAKKFPIAYSGNLENTSVEIAPVLNSLSGILGFWGNVPYRFNQKDPTLKSDGENNAVFIFSNHLWFPRSHLMFVKSTLGHNPNTNFCGAESKVKEIQVYAEGMKKESYNKIINYFAKLKD